MGILSDELALPQYAGLTAQEAADLLNTADIEMPGVVTRHDIQKYLVINGLWLPIKRSTDDAAILAVDALALFKSFNTADSNTLSTLSSILGGLVGGVTEFMEADKTAILALGVKLTSRAAQLGIRVRPGTVEQARAV